MNTLIQLDKWVEQTRVNCVEIYLSKHIGQNTDTSVVDISTDAETKSLLGKFGKGSFNKFKNYYHKDYQYSYDLSNDAQKVTKKFHIQDWNPHARIYVVAYDENVLASHRFPTTAEISNINIIERTTYRINNRLFIYNDKVYGENVNGNVDKNLDEDDVYYEYVYIRYNHSSQVDTKQMQTDIERVVRQLITPPSKSNPYQ